jgi:hypothetical protein
MIADKIKGETNVAVNVGKEIKGKALV